MQETITSIINKTKEMLSKLTKKVKILICVVIGIIIAGSLVAALLLNNTPYEILFTGLTAQEATEISAKLQEMLIPLKLEGEGKILVPKESVLQTKAILVSQGYPRSGFTYDYTLGNNSLMSTDADKANYLLFDLQERIAATVRMFDGVQDCQVNIVLGQDKKYVLEKDKVKSSAAIIIKMQPSENLSASQVNGVRRLVSKSISGIIIDDIVITDGNGNELLASENIQVTATELKRKLENEHETSIKNKINELIEPVFGADKFRIAVNSVYDVDKKIKEILNYIPSEDNKGVINKEDTTAEKVAGEEQAGDTPGTDSNAEIPTYPGVTADGDDIYFKDDKSYEYLVSQVKEQVESDAGILSDASVSITIDGQALSEEQSNSLKRLVANAAGIDPKLTNDKVEVLYLPFAKEGVDVPADTKNIDPRVVYIGLGLGALLLLIVIIIMLLLLAKKKKRKKELIAQTALSETTENEEFGVTKMQKLQELKVSEIQDTREKELQKEIGAFAEANPEIAAQLLKTWLRGGEASNE